MPKSQTSFDERIKRINRGQTCDSSATVGKTKHRRPLRARMLTFPFFVGVGILTGGTAYAFASVQPDMQWVALLADQAQKLL
ncbi:hypothetical protein Z946_3042 [Sulfitobacter noctilucicola]|uniref:Uncharacterized protein n=1 Tax=Sulfitobacter noctilucicola TaxID=1342301 RepID=A0A7W6Q5P4_9RHOB|nr:hypothetical protein [Sulfitobacter noctilucicola]KIN64155.1 hypothetical protein Z946_3042 [Sulfitobacter noctilucicola]MBB4175509.1 hypothetical protein [Sulfitobacter noctilucicola]